MSGDDEDSGGELVFCGCTDWGLMGRSEPKKGTAGNTTKEGRAAMYPPLPSPTRLVALCGISIIHVAAGSAASHCIAVDVEGRCFTWGRNEGGQLGHGDLKDRAAPTLVTGLAKQQVKMGAGGRHHSACVTLSGSAYAWGTNKHGQLGSGSLKAEVEASPVKSLVEEATLVACGAEFTVWLSNASGASILSAGLPQYGQLGHGTDHEYNAKDGSVKLAYAPQPTPKAISKLASKQMNRLACGNNHTVAADVEGFVYTWGFGGYGRLGHKEQKDEFSPRQVDVFQRQNKVPPSGIVAAGAAFSACTAGGGQLYMWGKVKSTGDNWMYPKPHMDLSGWNIRSMACGNSISMVAADSSCISFGTSMYGELGYGASGPKSSAAPKKIDSLEGAHVLGVACGMGHTMAIVRRKGGEAVLEKLEKFEGKEMGSKDADDEEDEAESDTGEEEEEEEDEGPKRKGKGRGRGLPAKRGRGAKAGSAKGRAASEAAPAGRGRGRSKAAPAPAPKTRSRGRSKK